MRENLPPIQGGLGGCLNCGEQPELLPMESLIAVGFGVATLTKDGTTVYDEKGVEDGETRS